MLYLAKVNIVESYYMSDENKKYNKLHIIQAGSEKEADNKVVDYYDKMTSEYSIYYHAYVEYINECIL